MEKLRVVSYRGIANKNGKAKGKLAEGDILDLVPIIPKEDIAFVKEEQQLHINYQLRVNRRFHLRQLDGEKPKFLKRQGKKMIKGIKWSMKKND